MIRCPYPSHMSRLLQLALSTGLAGVMPVAAAQALPSVVATAPSPAPASVGKAMLAWRAGDRAPAGTQVDAALALAPLPDALWLKARLRDAAGAADAADWYRKAQAGTTDPARRTEIDLRLAMLAAMRRPYTLVAYAARVAPAQARRVASVLALLGQPKAALVLERGDGGTIDLLREAQWTLAAGDTATARAKAWQTFSGARVDDDRRYALALLVEAYRDAHDLAGAAGFLAAKPSSPMLEQVQVDMLLELGRFDAAIARIERSADPALRRRLPGALDLAGQDAAGMAEYRRLIAADPHQPQWYGDLAARYLARGDTAQALAVYDAMLAANRGRTDVLLAGAGQMIAIGLRDQGIAMLARAGDDPASRTAIHRFLFDTYVDGGDTDRAAQELAALRRGTDDPALLRDVADGYERIGRPADALSLLQALETRGVSSGYDRQIRIAQLTERTGDAAAALQRWRALWAQTTLPARRSYLERQIVRLARQTGKAEALAGEIDRRLDAGRLAPGEIDLLVALRLAQGAPDVAVKAVERYAARSDRGDATTLRQLATLYARLHADDRLKQVLERLATIDPQSRDADVRQLILVTLRDGAGGASATDRRAELDRLVARLDDGDSGSTRRFRATVYAMASLDDQAIAQWQAALAAKPDDPDTLAQLATALKKAHRRPEAVALLQFAVEHAAGREGFAAAIDALIDQLADAPSDDGRTDAALEWAERRVLERIVAGGDDGRLLALLQDIGDARGDFDLQVRALEAMLPGAGDQRAALLRQLVTLNAGSGDDGAGAGPAIGDPARRIADSRRLLALGKSYPPDFYAELARTLLAQGDAAGAERAFAMMTDMGGLVNVGEVKGDAYAAAGRDAAALTNYGRALLRDQNNISLIVKTSVLREQAGDVDQARRWYWRALTALIARQPALAADGSADDQVDVRRYRETLVEGLLLDWPAGSDGEGMLRDVRRMFDHALPGVDAAQPRPFADYRQLGLIVDLVHRIGDAGLDPSGLANVDAALDRLFSSDAGYRRTRALRAALRGAPGATVAVAAGRDWPVRDLAVQADATDNALLGLMLALDLGDADRVRAIAAATLAREVAWRTATDRGGQPGGRPPSFLQLLPVLTAKLPPDRVRAWVLQPIDATLVRDALLFDLFRASPAQYALLEKAAGAPLFTPDALIRLTVTRGNSPLGISARTMARGTAPGSWVDRFSTDQRIALYEQLVGQMTQGGGDSSLAEPIVAGLLTHPLDAAQQARILAAMQRDIGYARDPRSASVEPLLGRLLQLETLPANRNLLLGAAKLAAARYPDAVSFPAFLERWFAGDRVGAFRLLPALGGGGSTIDGIVARYFAAEKRQDVDAFMADAHPTIEQARRFHDRLEADDGNVPRDRKIAYYTKLLAIDPDSETYANGLLGLYAEQQDWAAFEPVMRRYAERHADDRDAATMLAFTERLLNRPDAAIAAAQRGGIDPDDAAWIVRTLNRSAVARTTPRGGIVALFAPLYGAYQARFPDAPVVVAVQSRTAATAKPREGADALPALLDVVAADPALAVGRLRALWRATALVDGDESDNPARAMLIQALVEAASTPTGAAILIRRADVTCEIDHDLRVMDADTQARRQPLYDLVAQGLVAQGTAVARMQALTGALAKGTGDPHAMRLLVALAARSHQAIPDTDLGEIRARLRTMPAMAPDERVALAAMLAQSGDMASATGALRAAMLQMLYPTGALDTFSDPDTAAASFIDALRRWTDRGAARAVHADLASIMADAKRLVGSAPPWALPPLEKPLATPAAGEADR